MFRSLIKLIDVKTLTAGFMPVMLGTAYSLYAYDEASALFFVLLAIALALVQSSTNMLNDLFDYRRGADGEGTEDEKSLVNGEISPRGVLCIIGVFLVTASLIGLLIASQTSYAILLVAAAGGAVLVLYSAGPRPIAYTPFGELASGLTMGACLTMTVIFVQSGAVSWQTFLASVPTTVYISTILLTNNLCDLDKDAKAGRRTLPVLLGFDNAKRLWVLYNALYVAVAALLVVAGVFPIPALLVLLMLLNLSKGRSVWEAHPGDLAKGRMMALIGKMGVEFHVLLVAGLLVSVLVP